MKVVCSFVGGAGHLLPQLPLHRALTAAGHSLLLVGRESATRTVPKQHYSRIVAFADARTARASSISPLAPVDVEHELGAISNYFAGRAARRSAEQIESFLPGADMLVCDELDFGAMAAAQKAGVPTVVVAVIASGALVRPERLGEALGSLGADLGCADPVRPRGDFFVVPFAPAMRDPNFPAPPEALWMRPDTGPAPRPDGSLVATLGTEFNTESGDLFDRILVALAGLEAPSTVAVGNDLDPARFGAMPPHVDIERHVDFDASIPRASVVLHHGGSGLFSRCVLGGAPQLVFPMGADQPFTADQVTRLGLGPVLDPLTAASADISDAVTDLRADPVIRERVLDLRESVVRLPAPSSVVSQLVAAIS
jgi:hypothetical protein